MIPEIIPDEFLKTYFQKTRCWNTVFFYFQELLDQAKSGNPFDKGPIYSTLMQLGKGDVMYKLW